MAAARLHLIRHGLVDPAHHGIHYGTMDVALCAATVRAQAAGYAALAAALPRPAGWVVTPLMRTRQTAEAIFAAGYPVMPLAVERDLLEQDIGDWHGLAHDALPPLLTRAAHPFWPMDPEEVPPGGESMAAVIARVGPALERLAASAAGGELVIVTHGGAVRAALAHALHLSPGDALRFAIDNLALTTVERHPEGWRVLCVNRPAQEGET